VFPFLTRAHVTTHYKLAHRTDGSRVLGQQPHQHQVPVRLFVDDDVVRLNIVVCIEE
jgi:hypothetical protein